MINYEKELNKEQLEVVLHGDGPCLVLAGAGSGKTRTITYRVAYLLEKGVPPENILLVTFTNKAANEMIERVMSLREAIGDEAIPTQTKGSPRHPDPVGAPRDDKSLPWSGTFHKIANKILRRYAPQLGYTNNFTILDADDAQALLKMVVKEFKTGEKFPSANIIGNIISFARNAQSTIADVIERKYPGYWPLSDTFSEIGQRYAQKKKEANAMDFDDLLVNFALLLNNQEIQKTFAQQFQYILVDEYQDTNKMQAAIIDKLAVIHKNILVVGDDAQSIYSFRAADIKNILDFEKKYPETKIFRLETNYRSSEEILKLANNIISNNCKQYPKKLRALINGLPRPTLQPQMDKQSEANFIVKKISEELDHGASPHQIAVLFRATNHSQALEMALVKAGISYDFRGGLRFFERAHVKDVLSYLRILANPLDTAAWLRILLHEEGIGPAGANKIIEIMKELIAQNLNTCENDGIASSSVRIGEQTPRNDTNTVIASDPLLTEFTLAKRGKQSLSFKDTLNKITQLISGKAQTGWNNFMKIFIPAQEAHAIQNCHSPDVRRGNPGDIIDAIISSAYADYLQTEFLDGEDRLKDLQQMSEFARKQKNLSEFLSDASLQESFARPTSVAQNPNTPKEKRLVLSTIHQAKGLEWENVFIMNLANDAFPNNRALREENGLEEERRLFYVAVTRAKKNLTLTFPMSADDWGSAGGPSMFLSEISEGLLDDRSLLKNTSTILNDEIEYIDEDAPIKISKGNFLRDIDDL